MSHTQTTNEGNEGNETMTEQVTCPRCEGHGHIQAFGHYADGICFLCWGKKTITIDRQALIAKISPENRKKAEWIMASTPESYKGLSYSKLHKIMDFAHGGWGLTEAYPTMQSHWSEVGAPAFFAAQEKKLANANY